MAPNYDWLSDLNIAQTKYLEENYKSLWDTYKSMGYAIVAYEYGRLLDDIFDRVKSVHLTERLELPADTDAAIQKYYKTLYEHGNLKQIVVAVPNYHVVLYSHDSRVLQELRSLLPHIYVDVVDDINQDVLQAKNNCVILDDVETPIDEYMIRELELYAVPFMRRKTVGWLQPALNQNSANLIESFVERMRPCKTIR